MKIYATKGNLEYTISEEDVTLYKDKGFTIVREAHEVPVTPVEEVKVAPKPKQTRKIAKEVVEQVTE